MASCLYLPWELHPARPVAPQRPSERPRPITPRLLRSRRTGWQIKRALRWKKQVHRLPNTPRTRLEPLQYLGPLQQLCVNAGLPVEEQMGATAQDRVRWTMEATHAVTEGCAWRECPSSELDSCGGVTLFVWTGSARQTPPAWLSKSPRIRGCHRKSFGYVCQRALGLKTGHSATCLPSTRVVRTCLRVWHPRAAPRPDRAPAVRAAAKWCGAPHGARVIRQRRPAPPPRRGRRAGRRGHYRGACSSEGSQLLPPSADYSRKSAQGPETSTVPPASRAQMRGSYIASASTGGSVNFPDVTARTA